MMPAFLASSSGLLGVDIGTTAVKLLELADHAGVRTVKSFAKVPYESGLPDKKSPAESLISASLQKAIRLSGTLTRNAALAIPLSESITRSISLPAGLDQDELLTQAELEADQQLPYSLDELYWDFALRGKQNILADRIDIVLVASRRDYVEDRIALAEQSGLRVRILDIESYALENAVISCNARLNQTYQTHAVLMIDQSVARFSLMRDDGTTQAYELRDLTADQYDTLPHEINQILNACEKTHPGTRPEIIQLGGDAADLDRIATRLESRLNIPATVIDPLAGMGITGRFPADLDERSSFLIACGLALRAFDP
jgi:type IV pilus assembly protein PilM